MNTKRYSEVKTAVLKALESGTFQHEARAGKAEEKNQLQVGLVSAEFVAGLIRSCPGRNASCSEHHILKSVDVWELKSIDRTGKVSVEWYIKFYCLETDTWFISVHPSTPLIPDSNASEEQPT